MVVHIHQSFLWPRVLVFGLVPALLKFFAGFMQFLSGLLRASLGILRSLVRFLSQLTRSGRGAVVVAAAARDQACGAYQEER